MDFPSGQASIITVTEGVKTSCEGVRLFDTQDWARGNRPRFKILCHKGKELALLDILPSLKGHKGRRFLLARRLGGDTFGGFLTRRPRGRRLQTG